MKTITGLTAMAVPVAVYWMGYHDHWLAAAFTASIPSLLSLYWLIGHRLQDDQIDRLMDYYVEHSKYPYYS